MKKITAIIMVMAIAIVSVFATGLPASSPSSLSLNFTVTDSSVLDYGFKHASEDQATSFTVGSTATGESGISASPSGGYTLSLMDNSYYNNSVATTLYINLATPTAWACTTPAVTATTHPTINSLVEATAANNVTCTVETANAKLKVVYSAVSTIAGIVDRRTSAVALATFNVQWEAENVPVGTYTSTIAVTYTTT